MNEGSSKRRHPWRALSEARFNRKALGIMQGSLQNNLCECGEREDGTEMVISPQLKNILELEGTWQDMKLGHTSKVSLSKPPIAPKKTTFQHKFKRFNSLMESDPSLLQESFVNNLAKTQSVINIKRNTRKQHALTDTNADKWKACRTPCAKYGKESEGLARMSSEESAQNLSDFVNKRHCRSKEGDRDPKIISESGCFRSKELLEKALELHKGLKKDMSQSSAKQLYSQQSEMQREFRENTGSRQSRKCDLTDNSSCGFTQERKNKSHTATMKGNETALTRSQDELTRVQQPSKDNSGGVQKKHNLQRPKLKLQLSSADLGTPSNDELSSGRRRKHSYANIFKPHSPRLKPDKEHSRDDSIKAVRGKASQKQVKALPKNCAGSSKTLQTKQPSKAIHSKHGSHISTDLGKVSGLKYMLNKEEQKGVLCGVQYVTDIQSSKTAASLIKKNCISHCVSPAKGRSKARDFLTTKGERKRKEQKHLAKQQQRGTDLCCVTYPKLAEKIANEVCQPILSQPRSTNAKFQKAVNGFCQFTHISLTQNC